MFENRPKLKENTVTDYFVLWDTFKLFFLFVLCTLIALTDLHQRDLLMNTYSVLNHKTTKKCKINENSNRFILLRLYYWSNVTKQNKVVITWSRFAGMKFQPVQPGHISPYNYMWKLNFITARRDSFPPAICLDLQALSLNFFCKHVSLRIENP